MVFSFGVIAMEADRFRLFTPKALVARTAFFVRTNTFFLQGKARISTVVDRKSFPELDIQSQHGKS